MTLLGVTDAPCTLQTVRILLGNYTAFTLQMYPHRTPPPPMSDTSTKKTVSKWASDQVLTV